MAYVTRLSKHIGKSLLIKRTFHSCWSFLCWLGITHIGLHEFF